VTQNFYTIVPQAQAVTAVTGTNQQVASLALPAGEWSASAELWINVTAGTPTVDTLYGWISEVALTIPTDPASEIAAALTSPTQTKQTTGTTAGWILPMSSMYVNETAAFTIYLTAQTNFTGTGTILLYGQISASGTPATGIISSGPFVYVHAIDGTTEGYINLALVEWIRPHTSGGSTLRVGDRVIDVTEDPASIVAAV
jgi:hypothetical protein